MKKQVGTAMAFYGNVLREFEQLFAALVPVIDLAPGVDAKYRIVTAIEYRLDLLIQGFVTRRLVLF